MDGYFAAIRAHQHGIAVESMNGRTRVFFLFRGDCAQRGAIPRHPFNTQNTNTRPLYCTTPNYTLQFNIPQDGCTKVAGVMSPATPYKSTWQEKQLHATTPHNRTSKKSQETLTKLLQLTRTDYCKVSEQTDKGPGVPPRHWWRAMG